MQKIFILTGFIGSGKSTWSKKQVEDPNTIIINKDTLRTMIKAHYTFSPITEPLIDIWTQQILKSAIDLNFDIIIDETNLTKETRKKWISLISESNPMKKDIISVWFTESKNNVNNRMTNNHGTTTKEKWESVLEHMKSIFEEPQINEGFTEIIKISL